MSVFCIALTRKPKAVDLDSAEKLVEYSLTLGTIKAIDVGLILCTQWYKYEELNYLLIAQI